MRSSVQSVQLVVGQKGAVVRRQETVEIGWLTLARGRGASAGLPAKHLERRVLFECVSLMDGQDRLVAVRVIDRDGGRAPVLKVRKQFAEPLQAILFAARRVRSSKVEGYTVDGHGMNFGEALERAAKTDWVNAELDAVLQHLLFVRCGREPRSLPTLKGRSG